MRHPQKDKQSTEGLGRCRGGFSTKIHGVCDALGNPLDFIVTPGQVADCTQAIPLIETLDFHALLADKGYDSNAIIEAVESKNALCVIPPKSNRKTQREYDKHLYKERHKIECFFGFMKYYRRLAMRFDKTKRSFTAFLHFVAALQWLK